MPVSPAYPGALPPELSAWNTAVLNRENEQAVILAIGDSISEGLTVTDFEDRWLTVLQNLFRGQYQTSGIGSGGGIGYLPASRNTEIGSVRTKILTAFQGKATSDEYQLVFIDAEQGTFSITFDGQTTAAIDYGASAATVQSALEALSNVAPGDIVVTINSGDSWSDYLPYYVLHFDGAYSNTNVAQVTVTDIDLGTHANPTYTGTTGAWYVAGLGVRCLFVGSPYTGGAGSGSVTFHDVEGDQFEVWYVQIPDIDDMLVSVDGGADIRLESDWGIGAYEDQRYVIDLEGDTGPHEITISRHQGGGSYGPLLAGIRVFNGDGFTNRYAYQNANGWFETTANTAAHRITGDIDIMARVALDDYTNGNDQHLIGLWNSAGVNRRSYRLFCANGGTIGFGWSTDGSNSLSAASSAHGFTDGQPYWIRATMDVNDGAGNRVIKFYKSSTDTNDWSQVSWTLINTVTTAGTTSIYSNINDKTTCMNIFTFSTTHMVGKFYAGMIRNGYNGAGTVVANPRMDRGDQHVTDIDGVKWIGAVTGDQALICSGSKGIQIIDATRSGATTNTFATMVNTVNPNIFISDLEDWPTLTDAALATVALGVNDWATGVTPANYQTRLQTIVDGLRDQNASLPILFISWFEPHPAYHYIDGGDYAAYVRAMDRVANANELIYHRVIYREPRGIYVNNASYRPANLRGGVVQTAGGFGLHPDTPGHSTIAEALFELIAPYRPRAATRQKGPTDPLRMTA